MDSISWDLDPCTLLRGLLLYCVPISEGPLSDVSLYFLEMTYIQTAWISNPS